MPLLGELTVDSDLISHLALVKQAMLSREILTKVAAETELGPDAPTQDEQDELIRSLRSNINITGGEEKRRGEINNLFSISFEHQVRATSISVVEQLLDVFVEDTIGSKSSGSENAIRFLTEQVSENKIRLEEAERRLADFKKDNIGLMPDESGDYFSRIQGEQVLLDEDVRALRLAQIRRDQLTEQLTAISAGSSSASGGIDSRIRETQVVLEQNLLRFTERHPDVVALREQLAELEKQKTELLRSGGDPLAFGNPVYESTKIQLNEAELAVTTLTNKTQDRRRRIRELQSRADQAPEVEAELARLNRDYGTIKAQYEALLSRLEVARLSEEAERSDEVDFRIIEPPTAPYEPTSPNRLMLYTMVLLAGLGAGGGVALLLNRLRPVFNTGAELREFGLPVLGTIEKTWLERGRARRRAALASFGAACFALLAAFGAVAATAIPQIAALFV